MGFIDTMNKSESNSKTIFFTGNDISQLTPVPYLDCNCWQVQAIALQLVHQTLKVFFICLVRKLQFIDS